MTEPGGRTGGHGSRADRPDPSGGEPAPDQDDTGQSGGLDADPDVTGLTGDALEDDGILMDGADLVDGAELLLDGADPDELIDGTAAAASGPVTLRTHAELAEAMRTRGFSEAERERERSLLREMAKLDPDDPRRAAIRDEVVSTHLGLVEAMARRFRDRGEPHEDLVQVGTIGLIKAVDRFDPDRGVEFSTYATPTIIGEIKRHFRDRGWAIRVPRRLQELRLSLSQATAELSQRTGRSPTVRELAEHLGMSEDEILEGLESAQAYATLSLDAGSDGDDDEPSPLTDVLGTDDEALEGVEYRESLKPLLAALPARERRIVMLRFFGNMTQSQIAEQVGISQMHVSRLLAKSLAQLRAGLLDDPDDVG